MVHDFPSISGGEDFLQQAKVLKGDIHRFVLSPKQWRSCTLSVPLNWEEVKFTAKNKTKIPEDRGIYAFIVRHENAVFPSGHGYIFYIGETGNKAKSKTKRNLRIRFQEYINEGKKYKKRPKVYTMLSDFKEDLVFAYCVIPDLNVDLEDIETKLCDALLPPSVSDDFSVKMRPLIKAVWS